MIPIMMDELDIRLCETEVEYRRRCYIYKFQNPVVTWSHLAQKMNKELGVSHEPRAYSRQYDAWLSGRNTKLGELPQELLGSDDSLSNTDESSTAEYIDNLNVLLREIKKERVRLSDERAQNQSYIRKMSREETLIQMAREVAQTMSGKKQLATIYLPLTYKSNREGILCLSDWHYGMDVENYFNVYNPVECVNRVIKLRDETISKGKELGIRKLHVVNLSDLISGRIHSTIRLENRFDVITQIMNVSEIVAELLTDLSEHFEIEYRDCLDNHSRLEPNKKESLELESLARIIPWYLQERLKHNQRVKILYNTYADDIISFKVFDFSVVAVHGHKDSPAKIVQNMIAATRQRNDLVLSAHFHHFGADEENECVRVSNGTLMGVDTHSQDLRLTSRPSQNLIVANRDNVTEFICRIQVG
jgi:hypothetical protein